jgi:hypothetical protein
VLELEKKRLKSDYERLKSQGFEEQQKSVSFNESKIQK